MRNLQIDEQEKHILDKIRAGVLYCRNDDYSTILYANQYFYELVGYTREEVEQLFQNRFSEIIADNVPRILAGVSNAVEQGRDLDFQYRVKRKDGSILWLHDTAKYDEENNCFYVTVMDITPAKSVKREYEKMSRYLENMPSKIVISDSWGTIVYRNDEARRCCYFSAEADNMEALVAPHILGMCYADMVRRARHKEIVEYETRFVDAGGVVIGHDRNHLVPIWDKDGSLTNYMQISDDMSSIYDFLTRVPARSMLEYYYNQLRSQRALHAAFLCLLDIDDFKLINDSYGHVIGDKALQKTAEWLSELVGSKDYVCRFGGDEFLLLLVGYTWKQVTEKLEELYQHTKEPVYLDGHPVQMSYSIGVAPIQKESASYEKVFWQADVALYQVKLGGKGRMLFYKEEEASVS